MTVVEVLLRRRVFAPIAELASLDLNVIKAAKTTRKDSRDWILSQYVMKSGDVSLAQMVRILKTCRKDPSQLSQVEEFAGSRLRDSPVSAQLDALNRIAAARNPAIHELATMDAESTHADARAVVEACLAHDSGRQ
jgi:hypothetical protein